MASRTALDIIIVGAGFGGLSGAIELKNGDTVSMYMKLPKISAAKEMLLWWDLTLRVFSSGGEIS